MKKPKKSALEEIENIREGIRTGKIPALKKEYNFTHLRELTPEQQAKFDKFRENLRLGKVKMKPYSQNQTNKLQPYIKIVLKAIGHPEAWTTDKSILGHFPVTKTILKKLSKLGIECDESSLLINMAKQLRDKKDAQ